MPVRLLRPYNGQAAGTTYFGSDEEALRGTGTADDRVELATDYSPSTRIVLTATANVSRTATTYIMNSASAQTLTLGLTGYLPSGSAITVIQNGAGKTTIAAGTGVTINQSTGGLNSKGQYSVFQLYKTGPGDTWVAFGGLGA